MENIVSVSVASGSHNRGINVKPIFGCYLFDPNGSSIVRSDVRLCDHCRVSVCYDYYLCRLDDPDTLYVPLYDSDHE